MGEIEAALAGTEAAIDSLSAAIHLPVSATASTPHHRPTPSIRPIPNIMATARTPHRRTTPSHPRLLTRSNLPFPTNQPANSTPKTPTPHPNTLTPTPKAIPSPNTSLPKASRHNTSNNHYHNTTIPPTNLNYSTRHPSNTTAPRRLRRRRIFLLERMSIRRSLLVLMLLDLLEGGRKGHGEG